jgi:hypothetical protein
METSRRAKFAMVALLVLTLIVGGANLWATYDQVGASQRKWCATLTTLDKADHAAPPPQTAFGRHLVADFHRLRHQYGCG